MNKTEELNVDLGGNSEVVTDISDFLSFEDLGIETDSGEPTDEVVLEADDENPMFKEGYNPNEGELKIDSEQEKPKGSETEDKKEDPIELEAEDGVEVDLGEDEPDNKATGGYYKDLVKGLIEEGLLEDIEVFETDEGEIPFDEMEIDKDVFVALMRHNVDSLKENLLKDKVSIEGTSEFTQKLIEIEKHGGNVQTALKAYQTVKRPLESIDITEPNGQRAVCFLRLQQQGFDENEAKDIIDAYETKGILESKAETYKSQLEEAFDGWMEQQKQEAIQRENEYKEAIKRYRTSLSDALKNKQEFQLSDNHRKKLVDIATKEDSNGQIELDRLIEEVRKNPEDAAELVMFITNREDYLKKKSSELLKEEKKSTLRKINVISSNKKTNVDLSSSDSKRVRRGDIIPLDSLN